MAVALDFPCGKTFHLRPRSRTANSCSAPFTMGNLSSLGAKPHPHHSSLRLSYPSCLHIANPRSVQAVAILPIPQRDGKRRLLKTGTPNKIRLGWRPYPASSTPDFIRDHRFSAAIAACWHERQSFWPPRQAFELGSRAGAEPWRARRNPSKQPSRG